MLFFPRFPPFFPQFSPRGPRDQKGPFFHIQSGGEIKGAPVQGGGAQERDDHSGNWEYPFFTWGWPKGGAQEGRGFKRGGGAPRVREAAFWRGIRGRGGPGPEEGQSKGTGHCNFCWGKNTFSDAVERADTFQFLPATPVATEGQLPDGQWMMQSFADQIPDIGGFKELQAWAGNV